MTRLIVIRHGFSLTNKQKKFTGQMDVPLTPVGQMQAEQTAGYVMEHYRVDGIYASDLTRTCQTVRPLADSLGLPIQMCKDLREIDVGNWQGRDFEDLKREYPEEYAHYLSDPGTFCFDGGESFTDLMERGRRAIDRIAQENDGKTVVIGTHGGLIRSLFAVWKGLSAKQIKEIPPVVNCSITVVDYENGNVNWHLVASADHLTSVNPQKNKQQLV